MQQPEFYTMFYAQVTERFGFKTPISSRISQILRFSKDANVSQARDFMLVYRTLKENKSFDELKEIIDHGSIEELRKAVEDFGESSEKQFLFRKIYKIYEKMENKDDNKTS